MTVTEEEGLDPDPKTERKRKAIATEAKAASLLMPRRKVNIL